jgi:hypothetical protein
MMSSPAESLVDSWQPYFRAEYDRDRRNAQRQSFDEYWRWVKVYLLAGGSGYPGWLEQSAGQLARVRDEPARARLDALQQQVGRRIAAEWSKDSACRRVYSTLLQGRPNLVDWGRALQRAAGQDRGDGAAIEAALLAIQAELDRIL